VHPASNSRSAAGWYLRSTEHLGAPVTRVKLWAATAALLLVAAACGGSGGSAHDASTTQTRPFRDAKLTPLLVRSGPDVVPVRGSDGRYHLLWELPVQNATTLDVTVTGVEVESGGSTLLTLDPKEIADSVEVFGTRTAGPDIGPAQGANIFLTLAFDARGDIPTTLTHRVTVKAGRLPDPITVTGGPVTINADAVVPVLGPPIEAGSRYLAADTCCRSTRHIRAGLPVDNNIWFAQRFAVDYEQLDRDGRFVTGDPSDPASYTIYGKRVLAAGAGTVVHVLDGLDNQVPGDLPGTAIPLDEADGNTVVVDIGDGLYTMYGHLQKGSVSVAVGDRVKRGQPIARVGNTGNSSAPHLHFHVMDGPSPLSSNGRPYVIDSFRITGTGTTTEDFDRVENTTEPFVTRPVPGDTRHTDELPLDLSIVTFE
jgi:Peptidase family M23